MLNHASAGAVRSASFANDWPQPRHPLLALGYLISPRNIMPNTNHAELRIQIEFKFATWSKPDDVMLSILRYRILSDPLKLLGPYVRNKCFKWKK